MSMRRRKRKMSPLSQLARRHVHIKHSAAHLCGVLLIYVSILPHLVKPLTLQTSQPQINTNGANLSTLIASTTTTIGQQQQQHTNNNSNNHFDDDLVSREALDRSQLSAASSLLSLSSNLPTSNGVEPETTNATSDKTNVIGTSNLHQMISPPNSIVNHNNNNNNNNKYDQLEREPHARGPNDNQDQRLDDLLAIESNRSPALLAHLQQQHNSRLNNISSSRPLAAAPYEASTKDESHLSDGIEPPGSRDPSTGNQSSTDASPGGGSRLLSIQTVPTLTPIYLKHPLPPALRPQLIAFPHPASTRVNQSSSDAANGEHGSFALLPSWPNIYITHREHTVPTTSPTTSTRRPLGSDLVQHTDSKVPMNYPDWSRFDHHTSRSRERLVSSEVEYDRNQGRYDTPANGSSGNRRSNLTSEVEYEDSEGQQQQQRPPHSSSTLDRDDVQEANRLKHLERSRQLLADSWSKLLSQAAKNNAMESLMLTNRSIVSLLCDTNNMLVRFKFKRPFYGMVETNLDPLRQCRVFGNGSHYYEMRIDLFECGTRQEMTRLFINNIQIRFQADNNISNNNNYSRTFTQRQQSIQAQDESSRLLETEDVDEFKTLICSYPPPNSHHSLTPAMSLRDSAPTTGFGSQANINNLRQPAQMVIPAFDDSGRKTAAGTLDDDTTSTDINSNNMNSINQSDRIIDMPTDEQQSSALYYEPILVISGLLLLLLTIALALVSSAYFARRRQRPVEMEPKAAGASSPKTRRRGPSSGSGNDNNNNPDSLRFYGQSPAQFVNQRDENGLRPVAPPLIGLESSTTGESGQSKSQAGPTTNYSADAISGRPELNQTLTTSPNLLKHKQKQLRQSSRERKDSSKRVVGSPPSNQKRPSSRKAQQHSKAQYQPTSDELSNNAATTTTSSGGDKSSPSELSVTTIEIPYVSLKLDQVGNHRDQREGNSGNFIRNVSSQTPTKLERDAKSQTAPAPEAELVLDEIKRETSHERVVERMSYQILDPPQPAKDEQQQQQLKKQQELPPLKRASPLPFGSFRSKLTSPNQFKRLQNIVQLFDDDKPIPGAAADLYGQYRTKILKTISPNERGELKQMLKADEAFRSNVVDSVDLETFNRKLRDNPRYSTRIQSKATWDLLEEVLLDSRMNKPIPSESDDCENQRLDQRNSKMMSGATNKTSKMNNNRNTPAKVPEEEQIKPDRQQPYERTVKIEMPSDQDAARPMLVTRSMQHDKSSSLVVEKAQSKPRKSSEPDHREQVVNVRTTTSRQDNQQASSTSDNHKIQVSQSNSTRARCDDNTMINFDTVTNISTPRNFSAFTRSSFDLKQVTKFREHDSFPYMDD